MRTRLLAATLVAASLFRVMALRNTPFYQQAENINDLVQSQYSANPYQQNSFSAPSRMVGVEPDIVDLDDDDNDDEKDGDDYEGDDDDDDDDDDDIEYYNQVIDPSRHHKKRKGWVYLIRHGEKVKKSDKTGLSDRGVKRAKCLMGVFGSHESRARYPIDYILAQDFKPTTGQRRRPYETVKPLAKKHNIPLDHRCDRDDTACAAHKIKKKTRKGKNVLVVWEHARLSNIAKSLGVKGLVYPSDRYDIVFKIRGKKVHSIFSEECNGLDDEWAGWQAFRKGRHGRAPNGGRLIDDESWADV